MSFAAGGGISEAHRHQLWFLIPSSQPQSQQAPPPRSAAVLQPHPSFAMDHRRPARRRSDAHPHPHRRGGGAMHGGAAEQQKQQPPRGGRPVPVPPTPPPLPPGHFTAELVLAFLVVAVSLAFLPLVLPPLPPPPFLLLLVPVGLLAVLLALAFVPLDAHSYLVAGSSSSSSR